MLSGCLPAVLLRSPKMRQLVDELGIAACGSLDSLSSDGISAGVEALLESAEDVRAGLGRAHERLRARAALNLPPELR